MNFANDLRLKYVCLEHFTTGHTLPASKCLLLLFSGQDSALPPETDACSFVIFGATVLRSINPLPTVEAPYSVAH